MMVCNANDNVNRIEISVISKKANAVNPEEKIYEYDEAIDLTGNGWYNRGLLTALSIGLLGMGIDIFGFSVIVTGCSCDFNLELWQKSTMLSMPFVGPIVMSIPWGYISDTKGRRKCLLIALWGSFLSSFIGAFSCNWIMLAVMKVFSSCFCSAVQSGAYALLGESCSTKVRGFYMLIMTSVLMLFLLCYVVPGFFILQLTFATDLVFVEFTPWRLLTIVMAAPLGISALLLHLFYESPKFLVNAGREREALEYLEKMWLRNGGNENEYPVKRVTLREEAKVKLVDNDKANLLVSLWRQTMPLFKPPLLWRTLQLFFLTTVIYSINASLIMWMPHIVEAFTAGVSSESLSGSLCSIIMMISNATASSHDVTICLSSIQSRTLLSGVVHGVVFAGITLAVSKLASRKKAIMIAFLLIPMLSSLTAVFNQNNIASLLLYVGMTMTNLCMGVLFAYYVELFPTSYRGMAACLGVMVARISGLGGVNFLGVFLSTNCSMTFYAFSGYLLCGIVVAAYCLPSDNRKKV
ncbi:synaptic vesicle 2-related protein-like [Spodoptera frugiperda]|uniref:Synaptic vesicle 2-related protein-like n=1 Tax=Spodoptera frugiperda TaxID=7108 RepID=A0A9R0E9D1_SPOFR|nr:synaptic vesicle 2-related protein-like [Spodoptera frugiperda]